MYDPEIKSYIIVSPFKDENGNWRTSSLRVDFCVNLETTKNKIGMLNGLPKHQYQDHWQVIDVWYLEHKRFQAGDWVYVKEDAREWCEYYGIFWNVLKEGMVGKTLKVERQDFSDYLVYTEQQDGYHEVLPHQALAPAGVFATNEPEEMTLEEVCRELKREIKIKKS